MLQIVIPMAGRGSRFQTLGYPDPKPLIPVQGVPMIERVIRNLRPQGPHRFIFICQKMHLIEYPLRSLLEMVAPGSVILEIDGVTEGAACTVLLAESDLNPNDPMMIANCDQLVDVSVDDYLRKMDANDCSGLIMTMKANDPKWSFVGLNDSGFVTTVVEKQVISDEATVGIYNFKRAGDFIEAAHAMIAANLRVNNEFYVAPVYNGLIAGGARIGIYNIGAVNDGMYGLGTPEDLEHFLKTGYLDRMIHPA